MFLSGNLGKKIRTAGGVNATVGEGSAKDAGEEEEEEHEMVPSMKVHRGSSPRGGTGGPSDLNHRRPDSQKSAAAQETTAGAGALSLLSFVILGLL